MNSFPLSARDGEQSLLSSREPNPFCFVFLGTITMPLTHLSMESSPKGSLLLLDLPAELVCGTLQALFVLNLSSLILSLTSEHCCAWTNILSTEWGYSLKNYTLIWGHLSFSLYPFERMNSILGQLCSISLLTLFKKVRRRNTKGIKSFCQRGKYWPQMAFNLSAALSSLKWRSE